MKFAEKLEYIFHNGHDIDDYFPMHNILFSISLLRLLLVAYLVCALLETHPVQAWFVKFKFFALYDIYIVSLCSIM